MSITFVEIELKIVELNKLSSNVSLQSEDSDEEDLFAISDKWTFEWSSRRWSRLQDIDCLLENHEDSQPCRDGVPLKNTTSSESVLTDLSEPEISSLHSESSGGSAQRGLGTEDSESAAMPDSTSPHNPNTHYGPLSSRHNKTARIRTKDFLKRIDTLRSRGTTGRGGKALVISSPVLQEQAPCLKTLQCVDIINGDGGAPDNFKTTPSPSGSEGSSNSSGSAVSTPSLKERKPHHADYKRSGMYLEDIDIFSGTQAHKVTEQNRRNEFCSYEDLVVHIPKDHKPGTFPKALSIESLSPTNGASINWHTGSMHLDSPMIACTKEARPVTQCCRGSRISVYDNVPGSHLYASTGDLMDLEKEDLFPHLDDILLHVNGLQQIVDHWSKNVLHVGEGLAQVGGQKDNTVGNQFSSQITLDLVTEGHAPSSYVDKDQVSLAETESTRLRERRDSGVGASLTRPNR